MGYFPNYYFSISNICHELGHNLGSRHTHWCGWPGGAIDGCSSTEGGCPPGPMPPLDGGTIMSYCQAVYGNLNLYSGFGLYPGNAVNYHIGNTESCRGCPNSIVKSRAASNVKIYPSPSKDVVKIEYPKNTELITIYNSLGQVVCSKKINIDSQSLILNIEDYDTGVYFVFIDKSITGSYSFLKE